MAHRGHHENTVGPLAGHYTRILGPLTGHYTRIQWVLSQGTT
ncbi:hypothetical protein A2U01_0105217, partial [Trifolium medium]|nr:hypothetical protein [Trifolium medium]